MQAEHPLQGDAFTDVLYSLFVSAESSGVHVHEVYITIAFRNTLLKVATAKFVLHHNIT